MEGCTTSYVIMEMQIKQQDPLHTYKNGQNPEHWQYQMLERMWNRKSHSLLVGMENNTASWKTILAVCYIHFTIRSCNHALWYVFKVGENMFTQKVHMFIVVLFIIAITWKQSRCISVGELINKLYIQTMESFS